MIAGNTVKEGEEIDEPSTSEEAAEENKLSSEPKSSLASMFGKKTTEVPTEAPPSTRPKTLFDVNTDGSSITGDEKVDTKINDQEEFC